jgi:hypothetical protein
MKVSPLLAVLLFSACASAPDQEAAPTPDPTADDTAKEDLLLSVPSSAAFKKAMDQIYKVAPAGTYHGFTRDQGEPCTAVVEQWGSGDSAGIRVTNWLDNDAPGWEMVGDPSYSFEIDGRGDPMRVNLERVDTITVSVKRTNGYEVTRQKLRARGAFWADVPYLDVWSATGVLGIFGESLVCGSLSPGR